MQIRRVSRYLIWSRKYLETSRNDQNDSVWSLLAEKPVIELAGPHIRPRDNRIWYLLDPRHMQAPEISVYAKGRFHRHPAGPASPLEDILVALMASDGQGLRNVLRLRPFQGLHETGLSVGKNFRFEKEGHRIFPSMFLSSQPMRNGK